MNEQNLRPHPPFDTESGRAAQKKSVESRKKNQTVRDTTKKILAEPVKDKKQLAMIEKAGLPVDNPTYMDFIVASILTRSIQKGRMEDLSKLMDILGEDRENTNQESLRKAREILDSIDSIID